MSEKQIELKCKDFDSWVSFLGRLDKVGRNYIIKNDIFIACEKNTVTSVSTEKIPGKHITKDPLFIDDENCYVTNGIYVLMDIESLQKAFKGIKENKGDFRRKIFYFRDKERIGFIMGIESPITIEVAHLLTDNIPENIQATANSITWFNDLISPIENMVDNGWTDFSEQDLIYLRNNGIFGIKKTVGGRTVSTRLARSLFPLSGVSRMDTPLALGAQYAFLPSDESDVSILRVRAIYKCGQSPLTQMDCIHEYLVLITDEED